MAGRTRSARRYAEAAFEVARRDDAVDRWRDDLVDAAALLGDPSVLEIVDNPARPLEVRQRFVDDLLAQRISQPVRNLVALLVRRGRVAVLPALATEYRRLVNRQRGVVEAIVSSALPLTPDEEIAVRARIEQMSGATVDLQSVVDPELIGGLTVRVGDTLLDASVRGRLERLRDELTAGAR